MSGSDFLLPGQMMSQQLQGIVQNAAQTALDERTVMAMRQQKRNEMQQDMENNLKLAESLKPYDLQGSWTAFNKALSHIGRYVDFDKYDVASGLFSQAAELKNKGDFQGMASILKGSDQYLTNLGDKQRALAMQQQAKVGVAEQQARTVTANQQTPQMLKAQEMTNMLPYFEEGRLAPDEVLRLTGTDDPQGQQKAFAAAKAVVEGSQAQEKINAQMFSLEPEAYKQYAQQTGAVMGNPKLMADARISELLQKDRTPEEETELAAKINVYAPEGLRTTWNERSAQNAKSQLTAKLEDTRNRLTALNGNLEGDTAAGMMATKLDEAAKAFPDPEKMTDAQAKDAALLNGTLEARREVYMGQNEQKVKDLEQTAEAAKAQAAELGKRAVTALPAQRELIDQRLSEFTSMAKANSAMARLIRDENPYLISQREAEIKFLPLDDQAEARAQLSDLKEQRDKDLKIVEDEKARLMRREAILKGQVPAAERKAEEEERMRAATQAVIEGRSKGQSLTQATRSAASYMNVDAAELTKKVKEYYGGGISEAGIEYADRLAAASKGGQMPPHADIIKMKRDIAKKWGIDMKDLPELERDPGKPMTIQMVTGEERKEIREARVKIGALDEIEDIYSTSFVGKWDDLVAKLTGPTGMIGSKEADFRAKVKKLGAELRKFYIGAAQTKPELANIAPSVPDTDMSEAQFKAAMKATRDYIGLIIKEGIAVPSELGMKVPGAQPAMSDAQKQALERAKQRWPNMDPAQLEEAVRKNVR